MKEEAAAGNRIKNGESSQSKLRVKKERNHIIVVPGTMNPELYKCKLCEKIFRDRKAKCYHDSCATGIKPYTCNICQRTFVKRSHFEYHERVHSGYKPFKCLLCDKAFPQRNKLNRHMNSHKNEKGFACETCNKRYSKREDLKSHLTLHTGERPHVCDICDKTFGALTNLNRHVRTHSKERPYTCEVCKKSFKDGSLLIRHKKIHSKERPFSCAQCNRPFLSKSELARHLAIHTDVKAFSCRYCNTIFRRKDNLDRHIRHHHTEDDGAELSAEKKKKKKRIESETEMGRKKEVGGTLGNETGATMRIKTKKSTGGAAGGSSSREGNKEISKTRKIGKSSLLKECGVAVAPKKEAAGGTTRETARDEIVDSRVTPVIRGPRRESSNAVSVINGPIVSPSPLTKFVENKPVVLVELSGIIGEKKAYKYTEPIPLDDVVTINRRIEEKLYPETSSISSNYYYYGKNSTTDEHNHRHNPGPGATCVGASASAEVPPRNKFNDSGSNGGGGVLLLPPPPDNNLRLDSDETCRQHISTSIDNFVPTIRINDDSQPFHETISIHHWRRRTAELIRLSRSSSIQKS